MNNEQKITQRLTAAIKAAIMRVLNEHDAVLTECDWSLSVNEEGRISMRLSLRCKKEEGNNEN